MATLDSGGLPVDFNVNDPTLGALGIQPDMSGGGGLGGVASGLLGLLGIGNNSKYGNLTQATNPFAIAAGLAGANMENNSDKWLKNALSTVWANNNNANNLGTSGFQSQAGQINPLALGLTGQGSELSSVLAPLMAQMQGYQSGLPGQYSKAINSGLSPAMIQALQAMGGTAQAQTPAINQALGIIGKQGNTPLSQYFSSRGMNLAGTNPLLTTPQAAAIAGNQAATNFKAQQKQAMAQALARGGGAASQTFGGATAEGLADISDAGQKAVSQAFQNALLNQQSLGLQQQAQGTAMGGLGGNLANTQLGLGSGLLSGASNTQGNLLNDIVGGNLAGGQFGLGIGNALNNAQQGMFGQQSNLGQSGFGAQSSGLNSLAQILSGYGNILNSATGAAPGVFRGYTPKNPFADYLKSLARTGTPTQAPAAKPAAGGSGGGGGSSSPGVPYFPTPKYNPPLNNPFPQPGQPNTNEGGYVPWSPAPTYQPPLTSSDTTFIPEQGNGEWVPDPTSPTGNGNDWNGDTGSWD